MEAISTDFFTLFVSSEIRAFVGGGRWGKEGKASVHKKFYARRRLISTQLTMT